MTKNVITVRADTTVQEIARSLKEHRIGGAPVTDGEGKVIGMVSEGDLFLKEKRFPYGATGAPGLFDQYVEPENIAEIYQAAQRLTAADALTKAVVTVDPQDQVGQVAETRKYGRLTIWSNRRPSAWSCQAAKLSALAEPWRNSLVWQAASEHS